LSGQLHPRHEVLQRPGARDIESRVRRLHLMSEYPFFSVVIPTYNRAAFIEATLQSVLNQTYPHYEIIIVDNCSTDNTEELLQKHIQADQIRFIKHDRNYERARSRNTGMSVARGDYVTLLDSDDFMYPNNLAHAADYARTHPDIKCFHSIYELVDTERNVLRRYPMPSLKNQLRAIAEGNFMSCIGNFIHREIYQNYRFDTTEDLTGGEDWELWLRVLADYKVGRIEKIDSGILHHGARSVNHHSLKTIRSGLDYLCRKLATDPHLSEVYRPYLKRIKANSFLYIATLANGAGLFGEARHCMVDAVATDFRVLAKTRFWRVARRAWLKLQPR
jgi:glycosyltransferase involved in cell wall biosynthesis